MTRVPSPSPPEPSTARAAASSSEDRARPSPSGGSPPPTSDLEQRAGEVVGVEGAQVLEALADPDQLHRHAELLRDGQRDAALRGAVELRQDDPVHLDSLPKQQRLTQPVLAGGGVDRQERLVRRV